MNSKEFKFTQMLYEYDSLQKESLQTYDQQMSLVFGAAITTAGALALSIIQSATLLLGLPALLAILIGICRKSTANYHRIYRIASYITVFHEQEGMPVDKYKPALGNIAYHTRLRKIARNGKLSWKGGGGPKAESLFLFLLGIGGWILVGGKLGILLFSNYTNLSILAFSIILTIIFLVSVYELRSTFRLSKIYEDTFRALAETEKKE